MAAAAPLTARALNRATLARQGLLQPIHGSAAHAVRRLASLQAQHPEWPPIALAARAATRSAADLRGALERREVVRSSLMRITIHVVAAEDLWPMFAVIRPLRLAQWRLLLKADPFDSELGRRMLASHGAVIDALRRGPMTSLEIDRMMAAEVGPEATAATRPAWRQPESQIVVRAAWRHFSAIVPLVHVPFEGEGYGRSRYALATEWLDAAQPGLDEASARAYLARRYLSAFGPASVDDLAAYVGRGKGGIGVWRTAIGDLGDEVVWLEADDGRTMADLVSAPRPDPGIPAPARLLARWDSLLLSHAPKARDRVIADEHRPAVFTKNADVLPTFLVDGMVAGTWDRVGRNGTTEIALRPFARLSRGTEEELVAEAERVTSLAAPSGEVRVRIDRP